MPYLVLGCRVLLLGVLVVAVAGKLRDRAAFGEFAASIVELRLLPRRFSRAAARAAVGVETLTAGLLLVPATTSFAFALALCTMSVFAVAIILALRRGATAPCHCFGASVTPLGPVHVVRNTALAAVAACGLAGALTTPPTLWPPHPGGGLLALGAALVAVLLVVRLDDLAALFGTSPFDVAPVPRTEKP
ncbi:MauE/DoxX family redox-associated membrane protein [Streptomyces avicenniae]|uniref:MauE/DoxX family redox-associated membrane protein n=1 Tax=Streptomyces avicenniae TaxID=500153 RepID=UPI00069B2756|nr:MauE/DoxX family redox-associated membrane protein [Streptomyces avicenniae]